MPSRSLRHRGLVVAVVGPDAVGKTTMTARVASVLGTEQHVRTLHLGGPSAGTRWTRPARFLALGLRKFLRIVFGDKRGEDLAHRYPNCQSVLEVCAAIDRWVLVTKSHRLAADGFTILTDRYPGRVLGSANGPRQEGGHGVVARALRRLERGLYAKMPPPDILLRLKASPEETLRRNRERRPPKPDHVILASHAAADLVHYAGVAEFMIDAMAPVDDVARQVLQILSSEASSLCDDLERERRQIYRTCRGELGGGST